MYGRAQALDFTALHNFQILRSCTDFIHDFAISGCCSFCLFSLIFLDCVRISFNYNLPFIHNIQKYCPFVMKTLGPKVDWTDPKIYVCNIVFHISWGFSMGFGSRCCFVRVHLLYVRCLQYIQ